MSSGAEVSSRAFSQGDPINEATIPASSRLQTARRAWYVWAFWLLVLAYAALLLYRPAFGLIDDHKFQDTLRVGRSLPPFIELDLARFSPLLSQEYNLVAKVSSSAAALYSVNAVELIVVAWLLLRTGQAVPARKHAAVPYVATTLVLLSPAFAITWLRLWVQEKSELVLLAAFLLAYLKCRHRPNWLPVTLALAFANLSLYTKETAFVVVGSVGLFGLLFDRTPAPLALRQVRRWRTLHVLLIASCGCFLAAYYLIVFRHRYGELYGAARGSKLLAHLHAAAATLLYEPVLVPGLAVLAYLVFWKKTVPGAEPLRTLLVAAVALVCAYQVLGLGSTYYLLPAYFVVPYLATAVAQHPPLLRSFQKPWLCALAVALLGTQAALALQQWTIWRTGPQNLQAMLPRLEERLHQRNRVDVFLDGLGAISEGESYTGMIAYLQADGYTARDYDLRADVPADRGYAVKLNLPSGGNGTPQPFAFQNAGWQTPRAGDLLLVTPGDPQQDRVKFADRTRYALLASTHSWAYPNLSLKTLLRRATGQPLGMDAVIDPNFLLYEKLPDTAAPGQ